MRSILLAASSIMLFAVISCAPSRSGNRMMSFGPDRQSTKYKGSAERTTRLLTAAIKDDDRYPVAQASVELYAEDHPTEPLSVVMTTSRGRFNFNVREGNYVIVINHIRFREKRINVSVSGWDVDLSDIIVSQAFE